MEKRLIQRTMSTTLKSYKLSKSIIVKTWFTGFHKWPKAPDEVAFLRQLHRHVFFIECHFRVSESRELEFFMVQARLNKCVGLLKAELDDSPYLSCEEMAEFLANALLSDELPVFKVSVSEDGENSGVVELELY